MMPLWGIPLLALGLAFSAFVLALVGGDALASGYWGWGMMWGVGVFILLGTTFLISRLATPEAALLIAGGFWVVIVAGSHVEFYEQARDNAYRWSRATEPTAVPTGWSELDRDAVYRAWMAQVLDESDANGWWDHLRANATAGLSSFERAAQYVEGRSGWREVHRTGWRVWAGWFSTALFAAFGCLLAIAGAAVWSGRANQEARARRFAEQIVDDFGEAMRAHGATPDQIRSVIRDSHRQRPGDTPIAREDVARLLPKLDEPLLGAVWEDLEFHRQWWRHAEDDRALDTERQERALALIARFYDGDRSLVNPRSGWLLVLIAADRLHEASGDEPSPGRWCAPVLTARRLTTSFFRTSRALCASVIRSDSKDILCWPATRGMRARAPSGFDLRAELTRFLR